VVGYLVMTRQGGRPESQEESHGNNKGEEEAGD